MQDNMQTKASKTIQVTGRRMVNMELLRCISMMLVVVLHFLGKGNLLGDLTKGDMPGVGITAWLLESFAIVAVNVYMMISGYFLSATTFKPSRLLQLLLQVWTYSAGVGMVAALLGIVPAEQLTTYYYVQLLFPISMGHYWFLTAYVFLYLLLPFVGTALKRMTRTQMQFMAGVLLFAFCVLKSILPVRLDMDNKGYDCLWYLTVFVTAAYIRRFGLPKLNKVWKGLLLYIVSALAVFGGTMALRMIYLKTGSLGLLIGVCLEYNHLLAFLASLGLFMAFVNMKTDADIFLTRLILKIAPCTLGVYLLHENLGLRYVWQPLFGSERITGIVGLFIATFCAVTGVFVAGILFEMLRKGCMHALHLCGMKLSPYRSLVKILDKADNMFKAE